MTNSAAPGTTGKSSERDRRLKLIRDRLDREASA